MSFATLIAPARQAVRIQSRASVAPLRSFHASSSALKKKSKAALSDDPFADEDADEADDLDLFADSASSATSHAPVSASAADDAASIARALERREIIERISHLASLARREQGDEVKNMRIGDLRKVVMFSTSKEDLDGVEGVLKAWRYFGKKITDKTMEAIVGRCAHLGYPELALRLYANPAVYGLPAMHPSQMSKLHLAYSRLSSPGPLPPLRAAQQITAANAIYRLAALSNYLEAAQPSTESGKADKKPIDATSVTDDILRVGLRWDEPLTGLAPAKLQRATERLKAKGGQWAASVQRIEKAAKGVVKPEWWNPRTAQAMDFSPSTAIVPPSSVKTIKRKNWKQIKRERYEKAVEKAEKRQAKAAELAREEAQKLADEEARTKAWEEAEAQKKEAQKQAQAGVGEEGKPTPVEA